MLLQALSVPKLVFSVQPAILHSLPVPGAAEEMPIVLPRGKFPLDLRQTQTLLFHQKHSQTEDIGSGYALRFGRPPGSFIQGDEQDSGRIVQCPCDRFSLPLMHSWSQMVSGSTPYTLPRESDSKTDAGLPASISFTRASGIRAARATAWTVSPRCRVRRSRSVTEFISFRYTGAPSCATLPPRVACMPARTHPYRTTTTEAPGRRSSNRLTTPPSEPPWTMAPAIGVSAGSGWGLAMTT